MSVAIEAAESAAEVPSGIIEIDHDLTSSEVERLRAAWDAFAAGQHQLLVLQGGARFRQRLPDGSFEPSIVPLEPLRTAPTPLLLVASALASTAACLLALAALLIR